MEMNEMIMEKTINLEEILLNKYHEVKKNWSLPPVDPRYKEMVLDAMKDACQKTLKLASENAVISWENDIMRDAYQDTTWVDEESITDTMNQIK